MDNYKKKLRRWYDLTAERYDSWGGRAGESALGDRSKEIEQFNKILDRIKIESDSKILDVATGTGIYLIETLKRGGIGYGIDISQKMLDVFRKKIKNSKISQKVKELKTGDAAHLDYPANFFDIILCIGLFDYYDFPQVKLFLNEMKRVGKDECFFIVDFPNKKNKEVYLFQEKERSIGHEVYIHDFKDICQFLGKNGFNILLTKQAAVEILFLLQVRKNTSS